MKTSNRRKYLCRHPGCTTLVVRDEKGYCQKHKSAQPEIRRLLDNRKAAGSIKFYGSHSWKKTRSAFRQANPLCAECKRQGITKKAELVHHTTEREELEAQGLDPCAWEYLESLCNRCHMKELRKRRN